MEDTKEENKNQLCKRCGDTTQDSLDLCGNCIILKEVETGKIRDEQGRFIPGVSGNPDGRPPMTEEEKLAKKATKELIAEYKEKLAEALPLISPVLIAKAMEGDVPAIKELNDRVMGKAEAKTDITSGGEKIPVLVKFINGKDD